MTSRRAVLLGAGAALVAVPGAAQASPRDLAAYADFVAQQAEQDKFSGNVLLAHRGRPVLVRSHGQSIGPDTVFSLASITKMFTAVAIAQLVRQGRMGFHDELAAHLDGFPAGVTVHHLLTHTSGLGRPALGGGPPSAWTGFEEAMIGTLDIVRRTPAQFPPGTRHVYSNDGFWVLGGIVAKVSGLSYFDYVREHVFQTSGMTRTDFYSGPQVRAATDIARPYWTQPDGTRIDFTTSPYFPFTNGPAGGAYSTAADLLRFACSARKLLGSFSDLVSTGKVPLPPTPDLPAQASFYSYGHVDAIVDEQRIFGHSGSGPGAATRFDVFPGSDWVSVMLSNYDTNINPIVRRAREVVLAQS
jgi:CubicO group peptidase (beta-lactamase class C family)